MKSFAAICLISAVMAGSCSHDELSNMLGAYQCYSDAECMGKRSCQQGWCTGKHHCTGLLANDAGYNNPVVETSELGEGEEKFRNTYGIASAQTVAVDQED